MPELNVKALETAIEKFEEVETKVATINETQEKTVEALDELKNEVANLATKPTQNVETKSDKKLLEEADFSELFKEYGKLDAEAKKSGFGHFVAKTLNLSTPAEGGSGVDQVLDRDILKRARDEVGIIGQVGGRGMTRDTRRTVTTGFASVDDGFENVAGSASNWAETDTPTLGEVKSHVFKRHGKYPITDEAMVGSDINLWADLLSEVQIVENEYLEKSILFGDGSDTTSKRSMRGILSTKRLDITTGTGQSWKPTYGAGARGLDFFPAFSTEVEGKLPATDKEIVDWLIDLQAKIKPVYRRTGKFYMNDTTLQALKKVRDTQERPIFANYQDGTIRILGTEVILSDFMPVLEADSPFIIYGDLSQAIHVTNGDVNKTILDEYTVDGQTILKKSMEYFEMAGKNDSIVIGVASTHAS